MRASVIKNLYKKEILDVLRDKKTVLMMLVVPLILYPLLIIVGLYAATSIATSYSAKTYRVAFSSDCDAEMVEYFAKQKDEDYSFDIVEGDYADSDMLSGLEDEALDACIVKDSKGIYEICYMSAITNSSYAASELGDCLADYETSVSEKILTDNGQDADYILNPIKSEYKDYSSSEESAGNIMGTIIPFMLIISLLMGTMYPAIDTTAGERERGTLETMLTLPISSQELIFSKFLTVATIGIASAILNVISMGAVSVYMYKMVYSFAQAAENIDVARFVPAIIVCVLCIFAFAIFISAITMCVCAFARTYKEANNYITPLMLVVMFASFAGIVPNVELDAKLALVPVANICLLIKNMLAFKYSLRLIAIVLVSNVAYGLIAVLFLGKLYNTEGILFGDSMSEIKIFEKRSNLKKSMYPAFGDMWLVIAVTAVCVIYLGSAVQLKLGFWGVAATQLMIIAIPVCVAWYTKCDFVKTFRLKLTSVRNIIAALVLGIGALSLNVLTSTVASSIFKSDATSVSDSTEMLMQKGFVASIIVVAIAPAICEEMMFRGYILGGFMRKCKPAVAIICSAAIFGVYHMSIIKFFPTFFLALIIGYIAYETGSLIPGMIIHFMNNAISCVSMFYPEKIAELLPVFAKDYLGVTDVILLLTISCICIILGVILVRKCDKKGDKSLR